MTGYGRRVHVCGPVHAVRCLLSLGLLVLHLGPFVLALLGHPFLVLIDPCVVRDRLVVKAMETLTFGALDEIHKLGSARSTFRHTLGCRLHFLRILGQRLFVAGLWPAEEPEFRRRRFGQ